MPKRRQRLLQVAYYPAALRAESNETYRSFPPDPGRNRPKTHHLLMNKAVQALPRTHPGDRNKTNLHVVALWEALHVGNERFDLDTLRVPNRSPTPTSKTNDSLELFNDIWGARGPHFQPIIARRNGH